MVEKQRSGRMRGFTFIEISIVVMIIALLAVIVVASSIYARERARAAACQNHLKELGASMEMFAQANDYNYTTDLSQLVPTYISELPVCPGGGTYTVSLVTTPKYNYTIYCAGTKHGIAGFAANQPYYDSIGGLGP